MIQEQILYKDFIQNILDTRGRFGIPEGEYKERHHIIPRCMNGGNEEENLIDLYAREHFIAHKLLAEENQDNYKLAYAWLMMFVINENTQQRYQPTPEEYEQQKIIHNRWMTGETNPSYGSKWFTNGIDELKFFQDDEIPEDWYEGRKPVSDKTKELNSINSKDRIWFTNGTDDVFDYICPEGYRKGRSDSLREKISNSKKGNTYNKGKHWYNNGIKQVTAYECPEGFVEGALPMTEEAKNAHKGPNYKLRNLDTNRGFETFTKVDQRINFEEFSNDFLIVKLNDNELAKKYNITIRMSQKYRRAHKLFMSCRSND